MECKNKCYWNHFNECCPEDEESYDNAKPNCEDCPTYLRPDFEEHFWNIYDNIKELIKHRTCKELEQIQKFIINQRQEKGE